MKKHSDKTSDYQNQSIQTSTNTNVGNTSSKNTPQFVDKRSQTLQMKQLQQTADNYTQKNTPQFVDKRSRSATQQTLQDTSKAAASSKDATKLHETPAPVAQKKDVESVNYNDIAQEIHDAIDGMGTNEEKVYSALAKLRKNPVAIKKLKEVYQTKYKTALIDDLKGDFSGDELAHVEHLLANGETANVRPAKTMDYSALAEQIHNAIDGPGTDEEAVYQVLSQLNNNPTLIKKLKDEYKSKYSVELDEAIKGDFSGDELNYTSELLKDKTLTEQVNVNSKEEAEEAAKIIKAIKDDYGIDINSKASMEAIKKDYTNVPTAILDQLNTTAWEYKELVALRDALKTFSPILGDKRKTSSRSGVGQEVTTVGKVDQAIDDNQATGQLDTTTFGEYFDSSTNFTMFTTLTDSEYDFTGDNQKQLKGTAAHEIAHGLLEYKLADFVANMDYWLDKKTTSGVAGAEAPITNYGGTNASEDLSEAIMYFVAEPATLKSKCPKRHKFIEDTIKSW